MGVYREQAAGRAFVVRDVRQEAGGALSVESVPVDGEPVAFLPGQFDVIEGARLERVAVPISGDPARNRSLTHTLRDPSKWMGNLRRGDLLRLHGPLGRGWPIEAAIDGDVLLFAGGLGLAAIRPLLFGIMARRGEFGRVALLYAAHSPGEVLFVDQLEQWRRHARVDLEITVDRATDTWEGRVGALPKLISKVAGTDRATAFLSAPEVIMRPVAEGLLQAGLAPESISVASPGALLRVGAPVQSSDRRSTGDSSMVLPLSVIQGQRWPLLPLADRAEGSSYGGA